MWFLKVFLPACGQWFKFDEGDDWRALEAERVKWMRAGYVGLVLVRWR